VTLSAIGILALALIFVWTFGGVALRFGGALIAVAGVLGLSLTGNATGILVFAFGASSWLAGQLHFRLRHGAFKSAPAERICPVAASAWERRQGSA
jgi:hypothetical protein